DQAAGAAVATASASDVDAGDTLVYSIFSGNDDGFFTINPTTGAITTTRPIDYKSEHQTQTKNVCPTHPGGQHDDQTVTVNIANVNEGAVAAVPARRSSDLDQAAGAAVATASASDVDAGDTLVYSIFSGNDDGFFTINPTTGAITTT